MRISLVDVIESSEVKDMVVIGNKVRATIELNIVDKYLKLSELGIFDGTYHFRVKLRGSGEEYASNMGTHLYLLEIDPLKDQYVLHIKEDMKDEDFIESVLKNKEVKTLALTLSFEDTNGLYHDQSFILDKKDITFK